MQDCLGLAHGGMVSRRIAADLALRETLRTDVTKRSRQLRAMGTRFRKLKRLGPAWNGLSSQPPGEPPGA
jgi:hypothetical protein